MERVSRKWTKYANNLADNGQRMGLVGRKLTKLEIVGLKSFTLVLFVDVLDCNNFSYV